MQTQNEYIKWIFYHESSRELIKVLKPIQIKSWALKGSYFPEDKSFTPTGKLYIIMHKKHLCYHQPFTRKCLSLWRDKYLVKDISSLSLTELDKNLKNASPYWKVPGNLFYPSYSVFNSPHLQLFGELCTWNMYASKYRCYLILFSGWCWQWRWKKKLMRVN